MRGTLRILGVGLSEADAQLVSDELRRAGYAPELTQTGSPREMLAALEREGWDVILYACDRADCGVIEAVRLFKATSCDVPFIVLTHEATQELAAAAVKEGAYDYIALENPRRLPVTVGAEIERAEIRRERESARRALAESEAKYRSVVDNSADTIARVDLNGRFLFVNRTFRQLAHMREEDLIGDGPELIQFAFAPDVYGRMVEAVARAMQEQTQTEVELPFTDAAGNEVCILQTAYPWYNAEGEFGGVEILGRNITDLKRLQDRDKRAAARQAAGDAVASMIDGVAVLDAEGTITEANPALADIHGYGSAADLVGKPFLQCVGTEEADKVMAKLRETASTENGPIRDLETVSVRKDGSTFPAMLNISSLRDAQGRVMAGIVVVRDITEAKRAQEQLRQLAVRLQNAREEERERVSQEIHDELGQTLTVVRLGLDWLTGKLAGQDRLRAKAQSMMELAAGAIQKVKQISTELRPAMLSHAGLVPALEWHLKEFEHNTGISSEFETEIEGDSFDNTVSLALFRIFQEALTNVARHAEATRLRVSLHLREGMLRLEVADNGKGIAEASVQSFESFGLLGMKERAAAVGGQFHVEPNPGGGTLVSVSIPADQAEGGKPRA
ncbi:MAG: PAS domain S-box protein [Kiritimatiellae bacterium]|nr:PAS domain S-box protein [Kiritimatiellia bacterium]